MVWFSKIVRLTAYKAFSLFFIVKHERLQTGGILFCIEIILVFTSHNIAILNDMLLEKHFQLKVWSNPQIIPFPKTVHSFDTHQQVYLFTLQSITKFGFPKIRGLKLIKTFLHFWISLYLYIHLQLYLYLYSITVLQWSQI